ncbi:MAG: hypothetical protein P1U40_14485 [Coxiellaceae bacterium]|nr:hypothetical protein [Coxiellaceae bacterium]
MRQNNVNFVDFDRTLTKRHTITTAPCRFFGADYFPAEQLTVEAQVKLGYGESEDNLKNDIPSGLIQLGGDTISAVATFGNNHPYIAGYVARQLGVGYESVKLTDMVFEKNDGGAEAQFATAVYDVEGLDKPLCISHIHAPGNSAEAYRAFVAQFEAVDGVGKNQQLTHLKAVMLTRALCSDTDVYALYDDSERNCAKAIALDFIDSAYQVDGDNEAFTVARLFEAVALAASEPVADVAPAAMPLPAETDIATVNSVTAELVAYSSTPTPINRDQAEELARAFPGRPIMRYSSNAGTMVATYLNAAGVMMHDKLSGAIESDIGRFNSAAAVIAYVQEALGQSVVRPDEVASYALANARANISALMAGIGRGDAITVAPCYPDQLIVRPSSQAGAFAITVFASGGAEGSSVQHVLLSADNIQANIDRLQTAAGAKAFISEVCAGRTEFVTSAMAQAALNPDPAPVPAHTAAAGGMFAPALAPAVATDPAAVAEDSADSSQDPRQPTFH